MNLYSNLPEELRLLPGIYMILNKVNGKCYIGSTVSFSKRHYDHFLSLNRDKHYNLKLQRAFNKYGPINFEFKILEIVLEMSRLADVEQHWINWADCYRNGYNGRPTSNNNTGYVWTEEQRKNLSKAKRGFKHTPEAKAKMSFKKPAMSERMKGNQINRGRKYSEIEKIRMRQQPRKLDKWPHELGSKCKCRECKDKRNEYNRNYRNAE